MEYKEVFLSLNLVADGCYGVNSWEIGCGRFATVRSSICSPNTGHS